jgi:hypothetical protein
MRPAKFIIDTFGDQTFDGFTNGDTWNGWARPYFTFDQAERIIEAHAAQGNKAAYDASEDAFSFEFSADEVDSFPAEVVEGRKLYPVGAGCWIWEEDIMEEANVR